jgi:hypothetical protein
MWARPCQGLTVMGSSAGEAPMVVRVSHGMGVAVRVPTRVEYNNANVTTVSVTIIHGYLKSRRISTNKCYSRGYIVVYLGLVRTIVAYEYIFAHSNSVLTLT